MKKEYYIDFRAVAQYVLLYLMVLWNGSSAFLYLRSNSLGLYQIIGILLIATALYITLTREKEQIRFYFLQMGVLALVFTILVRFTAGGIGIIAYIINCAPAMATFLAYYVDEKHFPIRLFRIVSALVVISLFFWCIQLVAPQVIKSIFPAYQNGVTWTDWTVDPPVVHYMNDWGKWLFTLVEREPKRNCGLFSEPGNYQIVLNSMLFLLLNMPQFFSLDGKKQFIWVMVYVIAVISTQSTSAYICLVMILAAYFITYQEKKNLSNAKRRIIILVICGIMLLGVEYTINGENSFIYTAVIKKLFSSDTSSGMDTSGAARVIKINVCMELIRQKPFGAGMDAVSAAVDAVAGGGAGAAIFTYCAQLGVPCLLYTLYWQLSPILRTIHLNIWAKLAFLYLYANVMLAQSSVMYPFFVVVSLAVMMVQNRAKIPDHALRLSGGET